MSDFDDKLEELKAELATARDELRVQIHLAKADAKDEWEELEKKWADFEQKWDKVGDAAEDAAKDIGVALSQLGSELKAGYQRIRESL